MSKKDELKFNSDDIPYILNNMTETPEGTNPIPGTEETQTPGLLPEETNYLAPETTAPNGFYDPTKETPNTIPGYDPTTSEPPSEYVPNAADGYEYSGQGNYPGNPPEMWTENDGTTGVVPPVPQPPTHPDSENAHNELLENPKYAVHVHETQINRIVEVLENISEQINHLEYRLGDLEQSVRFSNEHSPQDGPPTPPSGTDYGSTT